LPRDADFPYWTDDGYPFPSREAMIERLSAQETLYPASRYFQYSNLGMVLAAEVVTAVTGKGFDATVRDGIVLPLGMQDTFTDVPDARRSGRLATGYSALRRDGTRKPLQSFDTRSVAPAAGLVSTAGDLARFAMWQNRLLGGQSDAVLRASTLREMQRVQWVDPDWGTMRGLGFGIWREGSRTLVGHSGGCAGYYSQFLLEPESHIAVAVLANAINADVWAYATQAYALVGPAVASAVAASEASSPDRSPALDRYAGIYETEWGQIAVLQWEDGLALLPLDTRSPADALVGLKLVDEHLFRVVRKDDPDVLGEVVAFEMNDRIATSFKWHSSRYSRAGP
jgi:CubicO group peptidase (beta-lactamase class C family)